MTGRPPLPFAFQSGMSDRFPVLVDLPADPLATVQAVRHAAVLRCAEPLGVAEHFAIGAAAALGTSVVIIGGSHAYEHHLITYVATAEEADAEIRATLERLESYVQIAREGAARVKQELRELVDDATKG